MVAAVVCVEVCCMLGVVAYLMAVVCVEVCCVLGVVAYLVAVVVCVVQNNDR